MVSGLENIKHGYINKIIAFSSIDGPGNRTVIFLQGCNFNCAYCHNPETINGCNHCGGCIDVCPAKALSRNDEIVVWDEAQCIQCDQCIKACKRDSSPKVKKMSVNQVMKVIQSYRPFISGVTLSGGECTLQKEFVIALYPELRKAGLTLFLDTNGSIDFENEPELMASFDMVLLDVKSFDEQEHQILTGISNQMVLKNLKFLSLKKKLFEVRTVVVSGLLDNERNVKEIARLLKEMAPEVPYRLIAYRSQGVRMRRCLGFTPNEAEMVELQKWI